MRVTVGVISLHDLPATSPAHDKGTTSAIFAVVDGDESLAHDAKNKNTNNKIDMFMLQIIYSRGTYVNNKRKSMKSKIPKAKGLSRHIKDKGNLKHTSLRLNKEHLKRFEEMNVNLSSWIREKMDQALRDIDSGK